MPRRDGIDVVPEDELGVCQPVGTAEIARVENTWSSITALARYCRFCTSVTLVSETGVSRILCQWQEAGIRSWLHDFANAAR